MNYPDQNSTKFVPDVPLYLQKPLADFDETLHVSQACPKEGFGTAGTSGYSPVQILGRRRRPLNASSIKLYSRAQELFYKLFSKITNKLVYTLL